MNKRDSSWAGSLKSYPRKPGKPLSPTEAMVDSAMSEWYLEKHRRLTAEEAAMVNSARVPGCPFCGSEALAKDGRRKVQKYLCRSCGRRSLHLLLNRIVKLKGSLTLRWLVDPTPFHAIKALKQKDLATD